ncbi:MAG TPA: HlyD family efflux transporter periplasmic adaptor subunit [Candidatus Fournierella merdavium]|nr:HlyD family efflux transporter periplasmic adaptor subunit [Candidatus Fournierella merdavium]
MKMHDQTEPVRPAARRALELTAAAAGRLKAALGGTARPGRYALRFFTAMLVLTLVARGTSGAAMARVSLASPARGTIVQQASASAVITAGESEALDLPAGVTVRTLYAAAGQSLQEGDPILQLDLEELQDALASAKATRDRQQAQLDQLAVSTAPDGSTVASAQQSLDRAREDYARTDERTRAALDEANAALAAAQTDYDAAAKALEEIQNRTDPAPTGEEVAAAQQAVDTAKTALEGARQAAQAAEADRADALLSAQRSVENADSALAQANAAYAQAQTSADLTARTNAAQAETLRLEKEKNDEAIDLLTALIEAGGRVSAPRDTVLTVCGLEQGQPCPEGDCLLLAREGSELLAQFSLPADQAEKVAAGQTVTVTQRQAAAEATVRTVEQGSEEETARVTAVLPETAAGFRAGAAQAELVFSRNTYDTCLPVSALRQDGQGSYVLTVEETKTTFGVTLTALRVPVTVLETDSAGQYAAVEGSIGGGAIVSSTRAVSPGASVRLEE